MNLKRLRYFLTVAEEGHFGRAAQRLHIVQPALSMQIAALEDELGARLLERTSRRVALTAVGRIVRNEARTLLEQVGRAQARIGAAASGTIGSLDIAFVGGSVLDGRMAVDVAGFRVERPDVVIGLREMDATGQIEALQEGGIDIGYCSASDTHLPSGISAQALGEWPWLLAVAASSPLARMQVVDARSLDGAAFVAFGSGGHVEMLHRLLGHAPEKLDRVGNTLTALAMVAAGLGLALVPAPVDRIATPGVVLRQLERPPPPLMLLLLSRTRERSPAVAGFLDFVRRTGSRHPRPEPTPSTALRDHPADDVASSTGGEA